MTSEPTRDEITSAIASEAVAAIAAETARARIWGGIRELNLLLDSIYTQRTRTTSVLRRAILAEMRDEINDRITELRAILPPDPVA